MQYFQRIRRWGSGRPRRSGVYRRPDSQDIARDEKFSFRSTSWLLTRDISGVLHGYQDGDIVEVSEVEIRAYLAETHPELDADEVLSGSAAGGAG
jgi:hypothetical protein